MSSPLDVITSITYQLKGLRNRIWGKSYYEGIAQKNTINKMIDQFQGLVLNINETNNELNKAKDKIKSLELALLSKKKREDIAQCFIEKIGVVNALIKSIDTIYKNVTGMNSEAYVYGSFVRQLFEFNVQNDRDIGYGNPINHDIDMTIFSKQETFSAYMEVFAKIISFLTGLAMVVTENGKFNGYTLIAVKNVTVGNTTTQTMRQRIEMIPHYHLYFQKGDKLIKIDLLAYPPAPSDDVLWPNGDFDINSLKLSKNGIETMHHSINILDVLYNIVNKQAVCRIEFDELLAPVQNNHVTFDQKSGAMLQLMFFLTNRLKIMEVGYKDIYSSTVIPEFYIEKEENCHITQEAPPYINIKLECGHNLSISALTGIATFKMSNYTEAMNCPLCNERIVPKLIEKKLLPIEFPIEIQRESPKLPDYEKENIMSDDVRKNVKKCLRNQQSSYIPQNSANNAIPILTPSVINSIVNYDRDETDSDSGTESD